MGPLCLAPGVFGQEIPVIHRSESQNRTAGEDQTEELPFFEAGEELKERVDR
jgi:hypothetical protein